MTSIDGTGSGPIGAVTVYDQIETAVLNESDLPVDDVMDALVAQNSEIASIVHWTRSMQQTGRRGGFFERDRYTTPQFIWDVFRTAAFAVEHDDVVGGIYEATESLAFSRVSVDCEDEDQENVWNQIMDDIDLESRIREMWKEEYSFSSVVCATYWGQKSYTPSNKLPDQKRARRKTFDNLNVPLGLSVLDQTKIVPVGNLLFSQEQLAYATMVPEHDRINGVIQGLLPPDPLVSQLLLRPYEADVVEREQLALQGLPVERLFLMNPNRVFRHTSTRPQYKRFADVRLKTVFELLDMKNQLKQLDRAMLLGGINYLVLVKRGSKERPASNAEVQDTDRKFRTMARVPVIVGDDRLSVEIISVKGDNTLSADRYDTIDSRIAIRLFSMFISNKQQAAARSDDSIKLARVIGRGLESRRHMLRRTIERRILNPIFDSNPQLTSTPHLRFHPNRVALDLDPALLQFILDIRDRGDMSRESTLEMVDLDEATEARRKQEAKDAGYDDIFQTTVPGMPLDEGDGSDNAPMTPKSGGRARGGIRNGGGTTRKGRGPGKNANDDGSP